MKKLKIMKILEFGNIESNTVLIQPVDDHDLAVMDNEVSVLKKMAGDSFHLITVIINSWNNDLSPWKAPPVYGDEAFGGGADDVLQEILRVTEDKDKRYYIGGYSLAGLFSLWAAYQTDVFSGVAAASPSVWFPGFREYVKVHEICTNKIYLSLGDREEKTRNPVMSQVGDSIREIHDWYKKKGLACTLEWNKGNHFKDPDIRTSRAFEWIMKGEV